MMWPLDPEAGVNVSEAIRTAFHSPLPIAVQTVKRHGFIAQAPQPVSAVAAEHGAGA